MNTNLKKNKNFLFTVFALVLIMLAVAAVPAAADTSIAWAKEIGDVTAADMAADGSVIYAAIADGADSTLYVYDSQGTEQNTFSISGAVQEIVCTADGSKVVLYTDGNEVYYIDDGQITWTETFTDITDIDISDVGKVLIVESNIFHQYRSDGSIDYNSASGTFDLGVIDPNNDYAIFQSGTSKLDKYVISTTNDYWGLNNYHSINTNFSDYQNLLVLYTYETSPIILSSDTLGSEIWEAISGEIIAISDETLSQVGAYSYESSVGSEWTQATSAAGWSKRSNYCSWIFDGKIWIGGGHDGTTNYNDVWYSSDGVVWTQATSAAGWSVRTNAMSWVFDGKIWIGGGSLGSTTYNDIWYSSDGVVWTQATNAAGWSKRYGAMTWVYDNKLWIGGGHDGSTYLRDVWYSSDGIVWTRATSAADWSARRFANSWTFDGKMWAGGGATGSSYLNDVWYSTTGASWTRATSAAGWQGRYNAFSAVFDGRMWLGGGSIGTTTYFNDIWYSSDGIVWTRATSAADWSARRVVNSWVYDNKLWIGGGQNGTTYYNDVWYSSFENIKIQPKTSGQTYVFYNYTGATPQHTQTTYAGAVDFTGTTELRTKPELSIYQYQASKTYTGAIESISISDAGDWLGTATASRVYHDQITSSGFGTSYNAILGSEGTVYEIATANEAAMSVIGQGQYTDIYSQIAARVGTYTAGGDVRHVDIAGNALWAASGGTDGKVYLFSKDESSNWYLEYSSTAGDPISALKISTRGDYVLAGSSSALTLYHQTSPAPQPSGNEFWFTLYTYRDSDSYRNAAINVSVYSSNTWSLYAQGVTDSIGKYVVQLKSGDTYKFDIGAGQKVLIYQATPSITSQVVSIYTSPISAAVTYEAEWDPEIGGVTFDYADSSGQTQTVIVRITRTDNWQTVYQQTFTGQQSIEQAVPIMDDTVGYKVEISATRSSGVTRNTFFVSASRDIVPIPLDRNVMNILFSCLLIFLAGLFSYISAVRGALVVALCAVFFVYMGWLTIPWYWLTVAVVLAFVAGFTQRRS